MKVEEAALWLKRYQGYEPFENGVTLKHSFDLTDETVDTILLAIRYESIGEPLTLDKIWKMKGRPVVMKYVYGGPDTIGIVDVRFVHHLGEDKIRIVFASGYITVNEKDYGHYYNLYDYNPAHIDREAWDDCPVCGKYKEISFRGFRTKEEAIDLSGKVYPHITGGAMFCPKCGKPRNERAWADMEQRLRGVR